jgi:hypothetical protein
VRLEVPPHQHSERQFQGYYGRIHRLSAARAQLAVEVEQDHLSPSRGDPGERSSIVRIVRVAPEVVDRHMASTWKGSPTLGWENKLENTAVPAPSVEAVPQAAGTDYSRASQGSNLRAIKA